MNRAMLARDPISIPISESTQVGEARRAAAGLSQAVGFDETIAGQVAIVVTELATNIVRHAGSGEIVLRSVPGPDGSTAAGLEVLSIDKGPGIANVNQAFSDGFSTAKSQGTGLGAVKRLSSSFDIHTQPSRGTVVLARFMPEPSPPAVRAMEFGAICLPKPGEVACGDAWTYRSDHAGRTVVLVADGLGHGVQAADASGLAVRTFRENTQRSSAQIVEAIHAALRSTRGAAVAVAELFHDRREISFTGLGNISAMVLTGTGVRSLVSHNGTAGAEARRIQSFVYPWPADSLLIMHSDGLTSHWNLSSYPGLRLKHPSLTAGVLYREFRRERDDVTVLVARDAAA